MRKLTLILLILVSTNVFAEWTKVGHSKNYEMTNYVDVDSIKKKGNKVKLWKLIDYKTVQLFNNDRYLSMIVRIEFDCVEETSLVLDDYGYSGNMRNDKRVWSHINSKNELISILPGGADDILSKLTCGNK